MGELLLSNICKWTEKSLLGANVSHLKRGLKRVRTFFLFDTMISPAPEIIPNFSLPPSNDAGENVSPFVFRCEICCESCEEFVTIFGVGGNEYEELDEDEEDDEDEEEEDEEEDEDEPNKFALVVVVFVLFGDTSNILELEFVFDTVMAVAADCRLVAVGDVIDTVLAVDDTVTVSPPIRGAFDSIDVLLFAIPLTFVVAVEELDEEFEELFLDELFLLDDEVVDPVPVAVEECDTSALALDDVEFAATKEEL